MRAWIGYGFGLLTGVFYTHAAFVHGWTNDPSWSAVLSVVVSIASGIILAATAAETITDED